MEKSIFSETVFFRMMKFNCKKRNYYLINAFIERNFHIFSLHHDLSHFAGLYVNKQATFTIDTRDIAKSKTDDGKVSCTISNPSGGKTEKLIIPQGDGTYRVSYTPFEEGCHTIDILYDNMPIPGSPFSVNVQRGSDPSKCRAYGPGLEKGIVNKTNRFTVETRGL